MLMNLTRMRSFNFEDKAKDIYKTYRPVIHFADQDIINIVFGYHPGRKLNYQTNQNVKGRVCVLHIMQ